MVKVVRKDGVTTVEWVNGFKITTDKINRYRYNELRKKKKITVTEVMLLLRKAVKKLPQQTETCGVRCVKMVYFRKVCGSFPKFPSQPLYYI